MKKINSFDILKNTKLEAHINKNMNLNKIMIEISKELQPINCPTYVTIQRYIKNHLNLQWDRKKKKWISYQKKPNSSKKVLPKPSNNIFTVHESELKEENSLEEEVKNTSNRIDDEHRIEENDSKKSVPNSIPNVGRKDTFCNTNNSLVKEENITISNKKECFNKSSFRDKDIDVSLYAQYLAASPSQKISISINSFIMNLLEQRIGEKYNMKGKNKTSKIIELALIEYLRITK